MDLTIEQALQQAIKAHRAGKLQDAESLYRAILRAQPKHPDANHNLGLMAVSVNKPEAALSLFKTALEANPSQGQFWLSYIDALIKVKQFDIAKNLLDQGKKAGLAGESVDGLEAQLIASLLAQGSEASSINKISTFTQRRQKVSAKKEKKKNSSSNQPNLNKVRNPSQTDVDTLLEHYQKGQYDLAENLAKEITQKYPDHQFAWKGLGAVFKQTGRLQDALIANQRAVEISPIDSEAHYNLGNVLKVLGRLEEAETSYKKAIAIKPEFAEARSNLGTVLEELGRLEEAESSYKKAIAIKPVYAEAHYNLGNILKELGRLEEAETSLRKAILIKPDLVEAHRNLGNTLVTLGRLDEAETSYRKAIAIKPDYTEAWSNLLFVLNYHPDKSGEEIYSVYEEYEQKIGEPNRDHWCAHTNNRNTQRRLKVGYVSPDFRRHSVSKLLEAVIRNHNKNLFELYAYSALNKEKEDKVTASYRRYFDHWLITAGLTDESLADRIRKDEIDILVDLAGHTAGHRLEVFARKPAPISVSWLGFGYTTGLKAIDYFLGDTVMLPAGSEPVFSEKLLRLNGPSVVYQADDSMGEVSNLPAQKNGYVTFGVLSRSVRINFHTIRVWAEILRRLPTSKLILNSQDCGDKLVKKTLFQKFSAYGITPDRLSIGFDTPPWDVLRKIDVSLDCFPHNSGTTLLESMYMGVPYITLAGRPSVGRIGSSFLVWLGYPEWIAENDLAYIEKAIALASDLRSLAQVRSTLRQKMQSSQIMNAPSFVRGLENTYKNIWEKWCKE